MKVSPIWALELIWILSWSTESWRPAHDKVTASPEWSSAAPGFCSTKSEPTSEIETFLSQRRYLPSNVLKRTAFPAQIFSASTFGCNFELTCRFCTRVRPAFEQFDFASFVSNAEATKSNANSFIGRTVWSCVCTHLSAWTKCQKQSKSTSSRESLESHRKPKAIFTKETTNIQTESLLQTCLDSSTFHCCRVLRFADDKNIQKFSETNHSSVVLLVSLLRTYQGPKLGSTWPYGEQHSTIWRPCYVLQ